MELPGLAELRGKYRQGLTSAGYVGMVLVGLRLEDAAGWILCLSLISAIGCVAWASTYRRARAIADIATSRIGSAAQGYVELVGRASVAAEDLILSPLSGLACIWYRYRVYSKDNSKNEWRQIDSGVSSATFEIADSTGACRVDPDHAEVIAPETRVTYRDGKKQVEELLFGGGQIYVLGEFTTEGGAHTVLSVREDVGALLATWKQDPIELKRRFDLDGNGEIDLHEWEVARRLAAKTVEQQHRDIRSTAEVHILRAPPDGRMFLISALAPHRLRRRFLWWSFFHLGVALLAAGLLVYGWLGRR